MSEAQDTTKSADGQSHLTAVLGIDDTAEGCTPADARVLREANHALAAENDVLRNKINRCKNRRGPLTKHEVALVATYAPEGVTNDEVAEIVAKVELMHGVVPNV